MTPADPCKPSAFAPVMCPLVPPACLVRPPLLARLYAFSGAGCARRLAPPIDRPCSTPEDVRPSARALASQLCSNGSHLFLTARLPYPCLQPAVMPQRLPHTVRLPAMSLNNFHPCSCREVVLRSTGSVSGRVDGHFPSNQSLNKTEAQRRSGLARRPSAFPALFPERTQGKPERLSLRKTGSPRPDGMQTWAVVRVQQAHERFGGGDESDASISAAHHTVNAYGRHPGGRRRDVSRVGASRAAGLCLWRL